jgi:hypothetical protein
MSMLRTTLSILSLLCIAIIVLPVDARKVVGTLLKRQDDLSKSQSPKQWAVRLSDTSTNKLLTHEEATLLAHSLHFQNLGAIGSLSGYFLFQEASRRRKRTDQQVMGEFDRHPVVDWFEQQRPRKLHKRALVDETKRNTSQGFDFAGVTDPQFREQWYLVQLSLL